MATSRLTSVGRCVLALLLLGPTVTIAGETQRAIVELSETGHGGGGSVRPYPPLFRTPAFNGGWRNLDLVVADLDRDGSLDVVSSDLHTLLGNGRGDFETLPDAQYVAFSVATADFNADGFPDVAVGTVNRQVFVYAGNGDGTFRILAAPSVPGRALGVTAADFDGDGLVDVAATNTNYDSISVLLNRADAGFAPAVNYASGDAPHGLMHGDLNADGRIDLVATNTGYWQYNASITVFLGVGDGTFESGIQTLVTGLLLGASALADFNADGVGDVVTAQVGLLRVLPGLGDGTFGAQQQLSIPSLGQVYTSRLLEIRDYDANGLPDILVAAGEREGDITLFPRDWPGGFGAPTRLRHAVSPRSLRTADFDRDGVLDLALGHDTYEGGVSVLLNAFADWPTASAGLDAPGTTDQALVDLDGDGSLDLAATRSGGPGLASLRWFPGSGTGAFGEHRDLALGGELPTLAVADLNADGDADLIVSTEMPDRVLLLHNDGHGTFTVGETLSAGSQPDGVVVGEFDGMFGPDLAVTYGGSEDVAFFFNRSGSFSAPVSFPLSGPPALPCASDLDGDGRDELLLIREPSEVIVVGVGPGSQLEILAELSFEETLLGIAAGDLNDDRRPDLAVSMRWNHLMVLLGNGDGSFAQPLVYNVEANGRIALGDLDADGHTDMVVGPHANGFTVLAGDGHGHFASPRKFFAGQGPGFPVLGDLDRDGLTDVVVANRVSEDITVLINSRASAGGLRMSITEAPLPGSTYYYLPPSLGRAGVDSSRNERVGSCLATACDGEE